MGFKIQNWTLKFSRVHLHQIFLWKCKFEARVLLQRKHSSSLAWQRTSVLLKLQMLSTHQQGLALDAWTAPLCITFPGRITPPPGGPPSVVVETTRPVQLPKAQALSPVPCSPMVPTLILPRKRKSYTKKIKAAVPSLLIQHDKTKQKISNLWVHTHDLSKCSLPLGEISSLWLFFIYEWIAADFTIWFFFWRRCSLVVRMLGQILINTHIPHSVWYVFVGGPSWLVFWSIYTYGHRCYVTGLSKGNLQQEVFQEKSKRGNDITAWWSRTGVAGRCSL